MTLSTGISRSSRTNAALFAKDQRSGAGALAVATPDSRMFWRVSARNFCAISGACSEENFKTMWSAAWQVAKIAVDGLVIAE